MKILSLFDGMSCGQQALNRLNINIDMYLSSEIDKYSMSVTKYNYPKTIFLGDVSKITIKKEDDEIIINNEYKVNPKEIILIGGSPCQGFSFAGKRKGAVTKDAVEITNLEQYLKLKEEGFEFEGQSYLFWEYIRIKKELEKYNKNLPFLLENVKMEKKWKEVFDKTMGVKPIRINSSLLSSQVRDRFYWCSLEGIEQPRDKKIYWEDIQLNGIKEEDNEVMFYSEKAFNWLFKDEKRKKKYKEYTDKTKEKMQMLEASHHKGYSNQRCFGIIDNDKTRYIHPVECERLQTVEDNYTQYGLTELNKKIKISRTQRYKMLGNGWTVDVITYLLSKILKVEIKNEE